jgi:hypothetical protein
VSANIIYPPKNPTNLSTRAQQKTIKLKLGVAVSVMVVAVVTFSRLLVPRINKIFGFLQVRWGKILSQQQSPPMGVELFLNNAAGGCLLKFNISTKSAEK